MGFYGHIVPRLDGNAVSQDFERYLGLVKKGIAGYIVFGGELEELRESIARLQDASKRPLIIASDLEQGLGQQVRGGTLFPPAMAITSAAHSKGGVDRGLVRDVFACYAREALYAGINTILAPVVDINTNQDNPIIAARAFGEDRETVSEMAGIMIEVFREHGIRSCAKHFPGHGDTAVDSHLSLPVLNKGLDEMEREELYPFRKAVSFSVDTVMLAHMSVPALDPSGKPVSVSEKATEYLRKKLGFDGIIMTDALDMGGLSDIGENNAGLEAYKAGVDILLHPGDADALAAFLEKSGGKPSTERVESFRDGLHHGSDKPFNAEVNRELSQEVAKRAITLNGKWKQFVPEECILIAEDRLSSSGSIEKYFKERYPDVPLHILSEDSVNLSPGDGKKAITFVASRTAAWKGSAKNWFREAVRAAAQRSGLMIVAGNPFIARGLDVPALYSYWCGEQAERALIKKLDDLLKK